MGLRDFTLFDVVQRNARLYADRLAFVFEKSALRTPPIWRASSVWPLVLPERHRTRRPRRHVVGQ